MKTLLAILLLLSIASAALAQFETPDYTVSVAERQHAAMMILVIVVLGLLAVFLLLWVLRRKGILKEEQPDGGLKALADEIARRSDEMRDQ